MQEIMVVVAARLPGGTMNAWELAACVPAGVAIPALIAMARFTLGKAVRT